MKKGAQVESTGARPQQMQDLSTKPKRDLCVRLKLSARRPHSPLLGAAHTATPHSTSWTLLCAAQLGGQFGIGAAYRVTT